MSDNESAAKAAPRIRDAFLHPSSWTMFFFGFASGLPFLLVAGTLAYWLKENGITLRDITMIASAGMAYSFKFLWAPLVDRLRLPLLGGLGQRRSWLLLTQLLVMLGWMAMASITPSQLGLVVGLTLLVAGISVDECGFTHLAYATEIAGAMLRRQQAQAVVAARKTLVEGAVGMVEMALEMLSEKNVVELDDERRAAMVSNLMVVLCGERDTQPVVNTGTLYQ